MEDRGWFRRKGRGATAAGSALSELQAILHPPHRHFIEATQQDLKTQEESGDPPTLGKN